jgi:hypothetical protein
VNGSRMSIVAYPDEHPLAHVICARGSEKPQRIRYN